MTATLVIDAPPQLSRRELKSVTADLEKRLLIALARSLPSFIGPDHLTALGMISMAAAGVCYRFLAVTPLALLGVNVFLFLNWFGDSLDGTVARVRGRQRPRYGFYVDHLVDAFGATALLAGLALSGVASPHSAVSLLIAYLVLQIHIALKAHTTGVFQIAFAGAGGTEARLVLAAMNFVLLARPDLGALVDPALWLMIAALVSVVTVDGFRTGRALDREERAAWPAAKSRPA